MPGSIVLKLSDRFTAGIPDILIVGELNEILVTMMIEVKNEKGKTSPLQDAFIKKASSIKSEFFFCGVLRSEQEFDNLIRSLNVLVANFWRSAR